MPAFLSRHSAAWVSGCIVTIGVAAFFVLPHLEHLAARGWGQYREPAPAGAPEARVRDLMSGDEPIERRFTGVFEYFLKGFVRHADPGFARVHYPGLAGLSGRSVDGLEAFARTGSLLAAWIHSGRQTAAVAQEGQVPEPLEMLRAGILAGVDPRSSAYWGDVPDQDQRIVEAADVARIVWLTRATLWNGLSAAQRRMIGAWLLGAASRQTQRNNWMLFRVVIDLILARLPGSGAPPDLDAQARARFDQYRLDYLEHGWFYDRPHGVDFYNTWGITYDLFWIHLIDPGFEPEFIIEAIRQSAELTQYLISPRGIPIMGRSICYRTAVPVPLLAATFLEPGGVPRGRALRALDVVWKYFVAHDSLRDGALTQGYFEADARLLDNYTGSGGCHWGLRSLVLAFLHPPEDAFWTAAEVPLPVEETDYRLDLPRLGWIVEGRHQTGEVVVTIPRNTLQRAVIEPYSWWIRLKETFRRAPLRPSNHEVKYELRQYSSATPYPLMK